MKEDTLELNDAGEDFVPETQETEIPAEDELTVLKRRAAKLNITYHTNIGVETLRKRIDDFLSDKKDEELHTPRADAAVPKGKKLSEEDIKRRAAVKEAAKLVRINVTCMNPLKREWQGELFTVGNNQVGSFKKYVPFNTTEGWHVPNFIYQVMKERQCQIFQTVTDRRGNKVRKGKLIPEFAIQVLPPLTKEELAELRREQAIRNGEGE